MHQNETAQRANALGTEKILPLIVKYALPAIVMMLISSLYNIVDKAFVGNFVGNIGITATTVAHPLSRIIDAAGMLICSGGSTLLALRLGEGKSEEAESILNNCFLLLLIFCAVLIGVFAVFTEPVLRLFGAEPEVMPYAVQYFRIILVGAFFNAVANCFGLFVRVDGSPKRMMICSITGCVINIILDPIAISTLKMGIAGAAWATSFSQIVSGLMVFHYFTISKRSTIKLRFSALRIHRKNSLKSMELGVSSFLQQFTGSLSQTIMMICLAAFATAQTVTGTVAQASVGIATSIGLFFLLPAIGVSSAIQPIISYNYGAKKYDRVIATLKVAIGFAVAMLTLGWLINMIFAEPLCRLFGAEGGELEHAAYTMRLYNMLLPLIPFTNVGSGFFQSINQPKKAIVISLSRQVICLIPMIVLLGSIFGQNGALFAVPVTDVISFSVALILILRACKKLKAAAISAE